MMYLFAGVFVVVYLYLVRDKMGFGLSRARMRKGDYEGALHCLRWTSLGNPTVFCLHAEGLTLSQFGHLAEAERRYRRALAMVQSGARYPRERLHACLGFVLLDGGRYDEAEQSFQRAIEAGDRTGNSQSGLAEALLAKGVEPDKALAYINQAIELVGRRVGGRLWPFYQVQAWALASLARNEEARETLARALSAPEGDLTASGKAEREWRAGMALLAMQQTEEACKHFRSGKDADPRGKYGHRCKELLRRTE